MQYIAKHFVRVNGNMYIPGEVLDTDDFVSEQSLTRLMRIGAVEPFGNSDTLKDAPMSEPAEDATEIAETAETDEEEITEADGGRAEIEIDAMDGVVSAATAKKSGRRRKR